MDIGFIGLGIMGAPMAGHLRAAGHTLHVHTRSKVPQPLLDAVESEAYVHDRQDPDGQRAEPHVSEPSGARRAKLAERQGFLRRALRPFADSRGLSLNVAPSAR